MPGRAAARGAALTALLLTWVACRARHPLADVPIAGGSAEARAYVRETLAAFERDTGGGRVELAEVRFDAGRARGRYNRGTDVVWLDPSFEPGADLFDTLTHELCHALDFAEDLSDEEPALWDELAVTMNDPAHDLVEDPGRGMRRTRRREAFSGWCSRGSLHALLLAERCPGDPPEVSTAMRWLVDHVWTAATLPDPVPADTGPGWVFDTTIEADDLELRPTDDLDLVEVSLHREASQYESEHEVAVVDLRDGVRAPMPGIGTGSPVQQWEVPDGLPIDFAWWSFAAGPPYAAVGRLGWHYPGRSAPRLFWSDGGAWRPVGDGCSDPQHQEVVAAVGDAWVGWTDERTVRFRRVAAP